MWYYGCIVVVLGCLTSTRVVITSGTNEWYGASSGFKSLTKWMVEPLCVTCFICVDVAMNDLDLKCLSYMLIMLFMFSFVRYMCLMHVLRGSIG